MSVESVEIHARDHAAFLEVMLRRLAELGVTDERLHMGFGENDLGRHLARAPQARARLREIKKELDSIVLATFEDSLQALGMPVSQRPEVGRLYLDTVARPGFDS
jgi:hypothetical protein